MGSCLVPRAAVPHGEAVPPRAYSNRSQRGAVGTHLGGVTALLDQRNRGNGAGGNAAMTLPCLRIFNSVLNSVRNE